MISFGPQVLSVNRLNAYLRAVLEEDPILSDVWVRGEVTNFHRSAAGHCYFALSNDGSQIRCALFRNSQRGLFVIPKNGDEILAHGHVSIYEGSGQYQLYVDNVAPEGTGILQLQFEALRSRLEAEGLFAQERKRDIPYRPSTIGVVTSAQGAVWHDICHVVSRRYPLVQLVLAPSSVQGQNAPTELITALNALIKHAEPDVVIIGRGGGSAEDLACFNDEGLARAIYASPVPVVSAVGHESDISISDLVADLRAPTPSAAAEICVPDRRELMADIVRLTDLARESARTALSAAQHDIHLLSAALSRCSPEMTLKMKRQDIDMLTERGRIATANRLDRSRSTLTGFRRTAALLDPRDVLRRGYALVTTSDGKNHQRVSSAESARKQPRVALTFHDGTASARIEKEPR